MPNSFVHEVEHRAQRALTLSPIHAIKVLHVEQVDDALLISGRVSTFYFKQMAQELVRAVAQDVQVVNQIEVD